MSISLLILAISGCDRPEAPPPAPTLPVTKVVRDDGSAVWELTRFDAALARAGSAGPIAEHDVD